MTKEITSLQNTIVKQVIELKSKASLRRKNSQCIIEGEKEVDIAYLSGIEIQSLLVDKSHLESLNQYSWINSSSKYLCSREVMDKISIRESTQNVVAIAQTKNLSFTDIKISKNPLVLILENIEKPGNIGALLRTADAANVDLVLCCEMQTDLFNPNVIRNSLGCVFSKQIIACSNKDAFKFCQDHDIQVFSTFLHTDRYYYERDFRIPTAIVFGTESTGISKFWQLHSKDLLKIPMLGKIDSMNVSNSASILLYEAVRQRTIS